MAACLAMALAGARARRDQEDRAARRMPARHRRRWRAARRGKIWRLNGRANAWTGLRLSRCSPSCCRCWSPTPRRYLPPSGDPYIGEMPPGATDLIPSFNAAAAILHGRNPYRATKECRLPRSVCGIARRRPTHQLFVSAVSRVDLCADRLAHWLQLCRDRTHPPGAIAGLSVCARARSRRFARCAGSSRRHHPVSARSGAGVSDGG